MPVSVSIWKAANTALIKIPASNIFNDFRHLVGRYGQKVCVKWPYAEGTVYSCRTVINVGKWPLTLPIIWIAYLICLGKF